MIEVGLVGDEGNKWMGLNSDRKADFFLSNIVSNFVRAVIQYYSDVEAIWLFIGLIICHFHTNFGFRIITVYYRKLQRDRNFYKNWDLPKNV